MNPEDVQVEALAPPPAQEFAVAGRNAVKLALSLIITWTVAFFIRFPVPRVLGPARFGELNFAENFAATFFTVVELGVNTYIYKEISVRPRHASDFWGGVNVARFILSAVLFVAMAGTLAATHHSLEVQIAVVIFGLAQLAQTSGGSLSGMLTAVARVNNIATSGVLSKLLWGAGLGAALFWWPSLPLLALPLLVSELARFAVLNWEARRVLQLKFRVDLVETKAVLLASLPYLVAGGAVVIGGRLNVAVLEFVTPDKREVGWFGASQNLAGLTMMLAPLVSWVLMPLLARAKARSEQELYEILRRTIEGLLVLIIPMTLIASLGADFWVRLAYRAPYAEAALSLRFLAYGFILIYLAMMLSTLLVMTGHGWSVSMISIGAIPVRPVLVALLAGPCARRFGPGGAALGAALAEIVASVGIVAAHFIPIGTRAFDRRLLLVAGKSLAVAACVIVLDHWVFASRSDVIRLALDASVYVGLALAVRAVKISEAVRIVRGLRKK
jgi:O-antigen/teichoic acid export membrane protein